MQRIAHAVWNGTGKDGVGAITASSGAFTAMPYSYKLRFENEDGKAGTNPEELIASAHAGCFTMAVAFQLSGAGYTPEALHTNAIVTMEKVDGANTITKVLLQLNATVPGVGIDEFLTLANTAKANCPVSRVLKAEISLEATLS